MKHFSTHMLLLSKERSDYGDFWYTAKYLEIDGDNRSGLEMVLVHRHNSSFPVKDSTTQEQTLNST
jgi:hypothetical protein